MPGTAYFQRFAVLGVWLPIAFILLLVAGTALAGLMQPVPARLFGLPFIVLLLAVVAAHASTLAGLTGIALLLLRRSPHPRLTLASALAGLGFGLPLLCSIYLPGLAT